MSDNHSWSENDEVIGLYLYRFGDTGLPNAKEELANDMGVGWGSMGRKIANFRHLDGKGGLSGYSNQCKAIYLRYKEMPDSEFEIIGFEAVLKASEEHHRCLQLKLLQKTSA